MNGGRSRWLRAALVAVALVAAGSAHSRMNSESRAFLGESFIPNPEYARRCALGFDAVLADFYWLRAVQLVGAASGDVSEKTNVLGRLIDLVTTLDPWVDHPYRFAAVWLTRDEEAVRHANRLLERGIAYHPTEWRNRYYLGFNLFHYLGENLKAAEVLEPALHMDGAPPYLGALVGRLRVKGKGLETAEAFLVQLARTSDDEYARAEYLKALDEIETERRARRLDAARERYWKRHGHDIRQVADLLRGPDPVLRRLPRAHPHFDGFEWVLDSETGEIVSSFYGHRYELHVHPEDRARRERWRAARARRAEASG